VVVVKMSKVLKSRRFPFGFIIILIMSRVMDDDDVLLF